MKNLKDTIIEGLEPEILIKSKTYIITYNGNSFDIPFLAEKAEQNNIDIDFDSLIKIDLYNYIYIIL